MKTGKVIFDVEMAAVKDGFAGTGAPLIVKDKVIVGIAGGEYANRRFIDAYDPTTNGRPRKVVMMANRNGFFYLLDRETGAFVLGKPFINTTWAKELTQDGKPKVIPSHDPTEEGTVTCPDWYGGTNFMSPSFDRTRNLFFVTERETCARFMSRDRKSTRLNSSHLGISSA